MESIVALSNLVCKRGSFQLGPLTWELSPGLFTCLVGPNGAGKSTLLQSLMGLLQLQSGSWSMAGQAIDPRQGIWKNQLGYAFDGQMHYERLSVGENLALHESLRPSWDSALAAELLSAFGLDSQAIVSTLSRGQRQALSLVLALAHRPRLLLLDEITNGMDSLVRQAWNDMIFRVMAESDMSVLMATHVMSDVGNLADRLVFMQQGTIIADHDKDSLLEGWRLISCRLPGLEAPFARSLRWEKSGDVIRFISRQPLADLKLLKEKGAIHIESQGLSLDDICYHTLEEAKHA